VAFNTKSLGHDYLTPSRRVFRALLTHTRYRENAAETKRRQIVELTGLQDRAFTHEE
jgi:hypothetical protein